MIVNNKIKGVKVLKIVAFANQKGGVGKSTTAFNTAYLLADSNKKVLMIDLDPQLSLTMLCNKKRAFKYSTYDVLKGKAKIQDAIISVDETLDLLATNQQLSALELEIVNMRGRETLLKQTLEDLTGYDYVIIDCPPSLSLLLANALVAATHIIIPCETDLLAYDGLELLLNSIAQVKEGMNEKLKVLGVVATFHNPRALHNKDVLELIEELDIPLITTVGDSVKVKDANASSLPLHRYDKRHQIVKQYKKIMEAVING